MYIQYAHIQHTLLLFITSNTSKSTSDLNMLFQYYIELQLLQDFLDNIVSVNEEWSIFFSLTSSFLATN